MLIFSNPGLIDLAAVTTLGVSVKQPGSFGRFGTGLKFAVATVLRGGGQVTLWRGTERWEFRTVAITIRDVEFQKVQLARIATDHFTDGSGTVLDVLDLGITTMLGRDWEPWMVLRELGCNALDEHGSFRQLLVGSARLVEFDVPAQLIADYISANGISRNWPSSNREAMIEAYGVDALHRAIDNILAPIAQAMQASEGSVPAFPGPFDPAADIGIAADTTTLVVHWARLESAYLDRGNLFLTGEPILPATDSLRILPGPSDYLFYRGIRAYKLPLPSKFTYDLLAEQSLTEDRTLAHSYGAQRLARNAILEATDEAFLAEALSATDSWEAKLEFDERHIATKPTREFIRTVIDLREGRRGNLIHSARQLVLKYQREAYEEETVGGGSYKRAVDDKFQYAVDILRDLGLEFADDQKFFEVPELPSDVMLTMLEGGKVFYVPRLLTLDARGIAEELLLRWVDLNVSGYSVEATAKLLAPFVLGRSKHLEQDEQLLAEDAALAEVGADADGEIAGTDEEAMASLAGAGDGDEEVGRG